MLEVFVRVLEAVIIRLGKRLIDEIGPVATRRLNVLFDPVRDVDNSPYGGQCLSFLSFKIVPGTAKTLTLTAIYRNHFYVEKLLGNLIGLGRLMSFVARETDLKVGALTVVSTHAQIDQPDGRRRSDIRAMVAKFDQAAASLAA